MKLDAKLYVEGHLRKVKNDDPMLMQTHIGILRDLARKGCYDLNEYFSSWTQDQLIEISILDGPPLIYISDDHVVTLTAAGRKVVAHASPIPRSPPHGDSLRA